MEVYWNLARLRAREPVAAKALEAIEQRLAQVKELEAAGRVTTLDRNKVEATWAEANAALVGVRGKLEATEIRLASLTRVPPGTQLLLSDTVEQGAGGPAGGATDAGESIEVRVGQLAGEVSQHQARAARAALWPQVVMQAGYVIANPNERYFPPKTEFNDSWDVTVALKWHVWDWGATSAGSRAADMAHVQATSKRRQIEDSVAVAVTISRSNVRAAEANVEAARLRLSTNEDAYDVSRREFEMGRVTNADLVASLLDVSRSRGDLADAMANVKVQLARLRRVSAKSRPVEH